MRTLLRGSFLMWTHLIKTFLRRTFLREIYTSQQALNSTSWITIYFSLLLARILFHQQQRQQRSSLQKFHFRHLLKHATFFPLLLLLLFFLLCDNYWGNLGEFLLPLIFLTFFLSWYWSCAGCGRLISGKELQITAVRLARFKLSFWHETYWYLYKYHYSMFFFWFYL